MQVAAAFNPLAYVVDAERALFAGELATGAVLGGALAAAVTAAVGLDRRDPRHAAQRRLSPVRGNACSSTRYRARPWRGRGYRGRVPAPPFGFYVHVPFCADPVRLLRLQHLHGGELGSGRARRGRRTPTRRWPRCAWPPGAGRRRRAGRHRVRRRRHAVPARRRATWPRSLAAIRDEFGLADGAEVTTEANPESVDAGVLAALRARRLHPGVARDAVGRAARAAGAGPHAHPRPGAEVGGWARDGRASSTSTST